MKTAAIRQKFIEFFEHKNHTMVASSSLVPSNDPTLLFTNSGMVQFKDVFLGFDKRPYDKAVTVQRCLRAGGKHNDLENVGYTARHHTFFEMLGNFSFGDYFKENAIDYAWEFLTAPQWLGLKKEHLWVTVFGGGHLFGDEAPAVPIDEESIRQWQKVLMAAGFTEEEATKRITRIESSDNFWMMGDTGPCGPCSEIFYDRDANSQRFRGEDPEHGDDCVEVWNLVFMQYNRNEKGEMIPLPKPCVDTGMGLERISAVMQGVASNYDIDLFQQLLSAVQVTLQTPVADGFLPSHYVIADHIRAAAFMIADGIFPSNEGRGYVLRRIIRRALRHIHYLNSQLNEASFYQLAMPLTSIMADAFPILNDKKADIEKWLQQEENGFSHLLKNGIVLLDKTIQTIESSGSSRVLTGDIIFKLYDTFGFPPDMTANIAKESNLKFDNDGYEQCMQQQRARSKAAANFSAIQKTVDYNNKATEFVGYQLTEAESTVLAIYVDGETVTSVSGITDAFIILNRTPFYAESGGQIGDRGRLDLRDGTFVEVTDTQKLRADVWQHAIRVKQTTIAVGDSLYCRIDGINRQKNARAHSAAHLLHAALRQELGMHVEQRGSYVSSDALRFDFSHHQAVTSDELKRIESIVNNKIIENNIVDTTVMAYDDALKKGAMALFGEKYGDVVRVVTIDPVFSVELCGGTHVTQTGNIGLLSIVGESAIASGIRRIESVTAEKAIQLHQSRNETLNEMRTLLKTPVNYLPEKVVQMRQTIKEGEKQITKLQTERSKAIADSLISRAVTMGDTKVLIQSVKNIDEKLLRDLAKQLCGQLSPKAAVLLVTESNNNAFYIGLSSKNSNIDVSEWLQAIQSVSGANGGGKNNFAQAGGGNVTQIDATLKLAKSILQEQLNTN